MKALRNFIDGVKPRFEKGGKYHFLRSAFSAFETFLYVPNAVTTKGAHVRDAADLKRTMSVVLAALAPALLFGIWNVGFQHYLSISVEVGFWDVFWFGFFKVLPLVVVSYVVGLGIELVAAQIRGREVSEGFAVTGMLIPLIMPVDVPLWMLALATAFAVIIGKEVFGGTGMNVFNPALLARAFVFFAYPSHISGDRVWIAGLSKGEGIVDGFSGATPLARAAAGEHFSPMQVWDMLAGFVPGSIGETSTLAILLGAALLVYTGVGSWRVMVSVAAGGLGAGLLFNALGANAYMQLPAYYHLMMGGFAFGAVFMATDPVSGAQTNTAKWIYGFLIGLLAVAIRVVGGFPEGMMLAILFMNAFAPLIDYCVVQRHISKRLKRAAAQGAA